MKGLGALLVVLSVASRCEGLNCFVGVMVGSNDTTYLHHGASVACSGACANTTITVSGTPFNIYSCDGLNVCGILGIYDKCNKEDNEATVYGCCCAGSDDCNAPAGLPMPPVQPPDVQAERCFVGASYKDLGGVPIGFLADCNGECANYTTGGITIYSCDPVNVCKGLGISGNNSGCITSPNGTMTACCCSQKDCNLDRSHLPTVKPNLQCFIGLDILNGYYINGGTAPCTTGECSNTTVTIGGVVDITLYACDPMNLCGAMNISGQCGPEDSANHVKGCCCGTADNCNVGNKNVTLKPLPAPTKNITCLMGVSINGGQHLGMETNCGGRCASVTLDSMKLWTCDPTDVCTDLIGTKQSACKNVAGTMQICCCSDSHCTDPGHPTLPTITDRPTTSMKPVTTTSASGALSTTVSLAVLIASFIAQS